MRDRNAYASLRDGLVGAWIPSISGSGLLLPDLSGQGNNGTLTNMGPEDWVSSQYGRALDFDGSNDYVNCGTIPAKSLLDLTSKLTLSAWVYIRSAIALGDTQVIVERGAYGQSANYSLVISGIAANGLSFQMNNSFFYALEALPIASWLHVCGSFDGSSGSIYYAGVRKNSGTLTAPASGTASLMLGSRQGTLFFQDGQLDDIRIYNRALTEPEIKLLASRPGIGLRPQRRTMYYAPSTGARRRRILTSMP